MAYTDYTSKATGNWEAESQTTWNEAGHPEADDDATEQNTHVITLTQAEACINNDVDAGGELDIATFNLVMSGLMTVNGTWKMDTSADTGLTIVGIGCTVTSTITLERDSIINNSGNISLADNLTITNDYNGTWTQTENGTILNPDVRFESFTLDVDKTLTATGLARLTSNGSSCTTINGILATAGNEFRVGCAGACALTFGADSNITGAGDFLFYLADGSVYAYNKVGAFSFTGVLQSGGSTSLRMLITGDFSNAAGLIIPGAGASVGPFKWFAGTLKTEVLLVSSNFDGAINVDCNTNNPLFELSEIDFHGGAGAYILTWTPGTGSFTLTGGAANIALDGQDIEDLIINATGAKTLTENAGTTDSLTITANELDMDTFNLESIGLTDVSGTLDIGTSAGTGLVTAGLTFNSGSTADFLTGSVISNSSHFNVHNSAIWSNPARGDFTQTDDGNVVNNNTANYFYNFTHNATKTMTLTGATYLTYTSSNNTTVNGIIAMGTDRLHLGGTGTVTFGANSDFTGNTDYILANFSTITYTNNKTGAFSYSGTLQMKVVDAATIDLITGDWSNATYQLANRAATSNSKFTAGTLKCVDFQVWQNNNFAVNIDNVTNSASLEISGDIDLHAGAGTYLTVWIKGTSTITLTGSSGTQTIAPDGQSLEDIVLNCAGATKELSEDFSTDSLSGSGGTLQSDVADTQRVVAATNTGVATGCTFKDISMGSANKVNAKAATNTSGGNNLGIVFEDSFGDM